MPSDMLTNGWFGVLCDVRVSYLGSSCRVILVEDAGGVKSLLLGITEPRNGTRGRCSGVV